MKFNTTKKGDRPIIQIEINREDVIGEDLFNDKLFIDGYGECIQGILEDVKEELQDTLRTIIINKTQEVLIPWWKNKLMKCFKGSR